MTSLRSSLYLTSALIALTSTNAFAEALDSELDIPSLPPKIEKRAQPEALVSASFGGKAGIAYKDNIFRSADNEESDIITYVAPGFRIVTDAEKYSATVTGQVEGGTYADNSENDYVDADLRGRVSYNLTQDTALLGQGRIRRDHIEIGAFVDDPAQRADEPTVYYYQDAALGIKSFVDDADRIMILADSQIRNFNYLNTGRLGGGRIIQDDRDRNEWYHRVRAGYVIEPGLMPYVETTYNTRNYGKRVDQTVLYSRDSDGYAGMTGVEYTSPDNTLVADAAIGYLSQDYDAGVLPNIDTLGARADAQWQIDPSLLLRAGFDRSIEEAVLIGTSGYIRTRVSAGFDYTLAPLWTVGSNLRYAKYDFQVNNQFPGAQTRDDEVYDASAYVQYDISEIYNVGLEYLYTERDSNDPLFNFNSNTVLLRLGANF
jgi:hypothetical protein